MKDDTTTKESSALPESVSMEGQDLIIPDQPRRNILKVWLAAFAAALFSITPFSEVSARGGRGGRSKPRPRGGRSKPKPRGGRKPKRSRGRGRRTNRNQGNRRPKGFGRGRGRRLGGGLGRPCPPGCRPVGMGGGPGLRVGRPRGARGAGRPRGNRRGIRW